MTTGHSSADVADGVNSEILPGSCEADVRPGDPIVDVRELRKAYVGWTVTGRRQIDALCGVTLKAHAGDVFGLLGPNGAGKTTLIKILLGVVKPSSGSASLFGQPVGSTAARQRVGYLPESLRVDRHHTARSALRYYGRLSRMNSASIARRSDELLELVGLHRRDRESVRGFSKGMYQRLGLAQALMHDPDLLVLDEPTDGLDPVGRNDVRKVIDRLRDLGKTIFLNSHILQEVEMVCTRVAILADGEIRAIGPIDALSPKSDTRQVVFDVAVPTHAGDPIPSIRHCFDLDEPSCVVVAPISSAAASHRITLSVTPSSITQQAMVDRSIDCLRAAGISVVRLESKRPTLEDTFMSLVGTVDGIKAGELSS